MSENRAPQKDGISPEEAERLSERIKPSWELEQAPFAAPSKPVEIPPPPAPEEPRPVGTPAQVASPQKQPPPPPPPINQAVFTSPVIPVTAASYVVPAQTISTQPAPPSASP